MWDDIRYRRTRWLTRLETGSALLLVEVLATGLDLDVVLYAVEAVLSERDMIKSLGVVETAEPSRTCSFG